MPNDQDALHTNVGASGRIDYVLPSAAVDMHQRYSNHSANGTRIIANTGNNIRIGSDITKNAGYIETSDIGAYIDLWAIDATTWIAQIVHGNWTVEIS